MVQNAHPPLDNPQVRWAISYAIDRNALAQLAYEGATVPREIRIDWNVCGAGLHNPEQSGNHRHRAVRADTDARFAGPRR